MPLVDAAAASEADKGHTPASMFAFNMFGQAVAFFQGIQVLVGARQPVETLPALRGLVILAARFEQMTDPAGPSLGITVRGVLDALEALDADADLIETRRRGILAAVQLQGLTIPDELAAPETASPFPRRRMTRSGVRSSAWGDMALPAAPAAGIRITRS